MDVCIASVDGYHVPEKCFVGVRVGDILKQRRYEPQHCYRFPALERRRNAKIDIYRHVGSCVLAVDPDGMTEREVKVAGSDPGAPEMKLKVNVQASAVDAVKSRAGRTKVAQDKAQDYLTKHNIQEALADAVKALLKQQPADPMTFICSFLADSANSYPTLSANDVSAKKASAKGTIVAPSGKQQIDMKPFAGYYKANMLPGISLECASKLFNKFPAAAQRLKPKVPSGVAAAAQRSQIGAPPGKPSGQIVMRPFNDYYKANCLPSVRSSCSMSLFAKFPAAAERLKPKAECGPPTAAAAKQAPGAMRCHKDIKFMPLDYLASIFAKFPAAADRLKPKVPAGTSTKTGSATKKFHTDIKSLPADSLASIFTKFPAAADRLKPKVPAGTSVKTSVATKKFHTDIKSVPADYLASIFAKFPAAADRLKPKVPAGTSMQEGVGSVALAAFNQTASVGTWCVSIRRRTS